MNRRWVALVLAHVLAVSTASAQVSDPRPPVSQTFTLAQALQYALDHYPSVRSALEQVNVSAANVSVAKTAHLPRFDAVWQTNRATANNIFGQLLPQSVIPSLSGPVLPDSSGQSVWGSAAGALLSWEPFDLGVRDATVREAEAEVLRARAEQTLTQLAVQHAVGVAFLAVATAQQVVTAAESDVQRRRVLADAAHTLANNQLRPGAEASRADAEFAAARTRAIQARQTLTVAQASLAQVLGIPDGHVTVDTTGLLEPSSPAGSAPAAPGSHPFAQVEQAAIEVARARESVLAKTNLPRLFLQSSAFARGSGANPDRPFDGGASGLGLERANWAAGVEIVFPNLLEFASLRARRSAAAAATRAEVARHDEAVLTVTAQQRTADALVDAASAIAQNTPIQLAAARQSETQARARDNAGLASVVEIAEAQNLLANAEYQNAAAHVDVWRALLSRAVASGSLGDLIERLRGSGGR